jgi:hypothetical protein
MPMQSVKLSLTCRSGLDDKYDPATRRAIDTAIRQWVAADVSRGIRTVHVAIDDAKAMQPLHVPHVAGKITAGKVKQTIDALVARLTPDYIVLMGSGDVVPMFDVENPTRSDGGDSDTSVPTDNPYASSKKFSAAKRANYLVPDRVVSRIPDLVGSSDASWLIDYLGVATSWASRPAKDYAKDLLICADAWSGSGAECVRFLSREAKTLMLSPPVNDPEKKLRARHKSLFHMIKCHGGEVDSAFYGQRGNSFPEALISASLNKRTSPATVVGAMCCFGASVFDPTDFAAVRSGQPPIPSVYLRQGAYGFFGSTGTAWVGATSMLCADWIVSAFLKSVLGGASLGRAALEAKQDFVRWLQQQGDQLGAAEEKTLLQFMLLGDPSIHPIVAASPATAAVTAAKRGAAPVSAGAMARRQRRAVRHQLGTVLRECVPARTPVKTGSVPADVQSAARQLAREAGHDFQFHMTIPAVQRVTSNIQQPEIAVRAAGLVAAGFRRSVAAKTVKRTDYQYYWAARYHKTGAPIGEIRLVAVQADSKGTVLRSHLLASSFDPAERRLKRETAAGPATTTEREIATAARAPRRRSAYRARSARHR